MLDKLHLNGSETPTKTFLDRLPDSNIAKLLDGQYQQAYRLNHGKLKSIIVKTHPRMGHISPLAIELNPSHWDSWDELLDAIKPISAIEKLTIDRIDHAVDLAIPIQKVHECVHIKRKHHYHRFKESEQYSRGVLTGFYFGQKPEVICIYDKGYQLKGKRLGPIPGAEVGLRTRFEVRQFRKKVVYSKLTDIHKYLEVNPFESIQFIELNVDDPTKRIIDLQENIDRSGLQLVYQQLNRSNNFKRTYQKCFQDRDISKELHEIYRNNLRIKFSQV